MLESHIGLYASICLNETLVMFDHQILRVAYLYEAIFDS